MISQLNSASIYLICGVIIAFVAAVCGILLFGVWGPGYKEASFIYFQF